MTMMLLTQHDMLLSLPPPAGTVTRLRLLGEAVQPTRIAFIEFKDGDSATAALSTSGILLGGLPLRISPSKTPVRGERDGRQGAGRPRGTLGAFGAVASCGCSSGAALSSSGDGGGAAVASHPGVGPTTTTTITTASTTAGSSSTTTTTPIPGTL
jgi:hypothetical protein